jgi:putative endonuclease
VECGWRATVVRTSRVNAKILSVKGPFWVYILASVKRVLYVGVTSDLDARIWDHKWKTTSGFSCRYNVDRLVYFEDYHEINDAIDREKQIKGWRRSKKIRLIESMNPEWKDLAPELDPEAQGIDRRDLRKGHVWKKL